MDAINYLCSYGSDWPSVYRKSFRRARKQHTCNECRHKIEPGHQYEYAFGVWSGTHAQYRTCEPCRDLRQWVANNIPCFCWCHGNMLEDAGETVDAAAYQAPKETVGLRFGYLRRRYARHIAAKSD